MLNLLYEVLNLQEVQSGYLDRKGSLGIMWVLMFCGVLIISTASPWTGNFETQQGVEIEVV